MILSAYSVVISAKAISKKRLPECIVENLSRKDNTINICNFLKLLQIEDFFSISECQENLFTAAIYIML